MSLPCAQAVCIDASTTGPSPIDIMSEHLIAEVQKYPELYDRSNPQHKNAEKKLEIWELIGSNLSTSGNIEGAEAAKRWKDIRDSFVKSRRRGLPPRNPNKVYKPYRHAPLLDFLLPCLSGPKKKLADPSLENGEKVDGTMISEGPTPEKKMKKAIAKTALQEAIDVKPNIAKGEHIQDLDEDDLFFRSMAYSCKKLPHNVKSFVRFKIHEIIFQAENQIIAMSDIAQPPTNDD